MGKRLFLLYLFIISQLFLAPTFLTAKDTVKIVGISNVGITETVPLPEPEPEPEPVIEPVVSEPVVASTPVAAPKAGSKKTVSNSITILGRTINIVNTSDTAVDSSDHVNRYGAKFLYGHNSSNVFGNLKNIKAGNRFTVTIDGTTREYKVYAVVIYDKIDDYTLRLDGKNISMSVVAKARYDGAYHSLSIMTCHGKMYGNNDASQRLVVFADEV